MASAAEGEGQVITIDRLEEWTARIERANEAKQLV
jgi:hypothetical protein